MFAPGLPHVRGNEASESGSKVKVKVESGTKPQESRWWNRDSIVSGAIQAHRQWMSDTRASLQNAAVNLKVSLDAVPSEFKEVLKIEIKLGETRRHAVKLVLGDVKVECGSPVSSGHTAQPIAGSPTNLEFIRITIENN